MLKGLNNYQLENCKKALQEIEKIRYLNEREKYLLNAISGRLKITNLETEISQLENQKPDNPQQQEEKEQKIEQKKQELVKVKEEEKKRDSNPPPPKLPQPQNNEDYKNWNHSQLLAEIQKLKAEIEALKKDKGINSSEKQSQLRMKLEKLEKAKRDNKQNQQNNSDSKLPKGLIIGGAIGITMIGLLGMLFVIKNKRKRRKRK
jgi:DNA repair exonuclease SbcCD ATPase subunit